MPSLDTKMMWSVAAGVLIATLAPALMAKAWERVQALRAG